MRVEGVMHLLVCMLVGWHCNGHDQCIASTTSLVCVHTHTHKPARADSPTTSGEYKGGDGRRGTAAIEGAGQGVVGRH